MIRIPFLLTATCLLLLTASTAQGETLNQFLASRAQKQGTEKDRAKLEESFRHHLGSYGLESLSRQDRRAAASATWRSFNMARTSGRGLDESVSLARAVYIAAGKGAALPFLEAVLEKGLEGKRDGRLMETLLLDMGDLARSRASEASILWLGMQGAMGKLSHRQLQQKKMEMLRKTWKPVGATKGPDPALLALEKQGAPKLHSGDVGALRIYLANLGKTAYEGRLVFALEGINTCSLDETTTTWDLKLKPMEVMTALVVIRAHDGLSAGQSEGKLVFVETGDNKTDALLANNKFPIQIQTTADKTTSPLWLLDRAKPSVKETASLNMKAELLLPQVKKALYLVPISGTESSTKGQNPPICPDHSDGFLIIDNSPKNIDISLETENPLQQSLQNKLATLRNLQAAQWWHLACLENAKRELEMYKASGHKIPTEYRKHFWNVIKARRAKLQTAESLAESILEKMKQVQQDMFNAIP
ncbi:MAG: hypothetical protein JRF33_06185 [Deltaproteobacteria bacterium]|nr:hypothetical protein [Deltaproteobacteria bacterium]